MHSTSEVKRISRIKIRRDRSLLENIDIELARLEVELSQISRSAPDYDIVEEALNILTKARRQTELRIFSSWHDVLDL